MKISQLIRPNIQDISPYTCARMQNSGQNNIFLDANENRFGSSFDVKLNDEKINISDYPDPYQMDLKQSILNCQNYKEYNLTFENIFLSNGSDESIDMLIRIFCKPGKDAIMITSPTFGMYKVAAMMNDVKIIDSPITSEIIKDRNLKIIFICRPNNPTGEVIGLDIVESVLRDFEGIVVVDEAYIDFSEYESLISILPKYNNLIILQTLSKSYGMAGIRLGMTFANKEIIDIFNKIKMPYNINILTQKVALKAFENTNIAKMNMNLENSKKNKIDLINYLSSVKFISKIYPGQGNFILCESLKAKEMYEYLKNNGIIIRYFLKMKDKLRITIGTDNDIEKLKKLLSIYK